VTITKAMTEQAIAATDWNKVDAMTDADIARQVADNPDAAPLDWSDEPASRLLQLRKRLGMRQEEFATAYRIKIGTLRAIEQGRRRPSGTTLTLLQVIERVPDTVRKVLAVDGG
jgi:putative transcriptional regulator